MSARRMGSSHLPCAPLTRWCSRAANATMDGMSTFTTLLSTSPATSSTTSPSGSYAAAPPRQASSWRLRSTSRRACMLDSRHVQSQGRVRGLRHRSRESANAESSFLWRSPCSRDSPLRRPLHPRSRSSCKRVPRAVVRIGSAAGAGRSAGCRRGGSSATRSACRCARVRRTRRRSEVVTRSVVRPLLERREVERLGAGQPERCDRLAVGELQRQHAHADQVGAVDALVGLREDEADAEQVAAPSPPSRATSPTRTPRRPARTAERPARAAVIAAS